MSAETNANARDFLAALPAAFPTPELGVEGEETPESRSSGIERFDGRLPKVITDTLRRLF